MKIRVRSLTDDEKRLVAKGIDAEADELRRKIRGLQEEIHGLHDLKRQLTGEGETGQEGNEVRKQLRLRKASGKLRTSGAKPRKGIGKRRMSAAARKAVSARMKRYWAKRRKK